MAWLSVLPVPAGAFVLDVTVDTSGLSGTAANLAFDFIDGDGAVNNTVQIGGFSTDGSFIPGDALLSGDVSGLLNATVMIGDSSFFNELLQPITLGTSLQFRLDATDLFDAAGSFPDSFAFYILDSNFLLPLFVTTDNLAADALFAFDPTGTGTCGGDLQVFTAPNGAASWTVRCAGNVPEPGPWALMLIGGVMAFLRKKRNKLPV